MQATASLVTPSSLSANSARIPQMCSSAAERWRSPAAGSGRDAGANAGGSQVQCFVRPGPSDVARLAREPSRLGFPDALAHGRLCSRSHSGGNVRGVLADAKQDPGLAVVEKVHAQEIEPREPRDAALLHRKPIVIAHRQVDPAIVK